MELSTERPTVLVIDDERGPRESLRMILSPTYRVLQAGCGSEALEKLRTTPVDLVTLDLNMPGMNGGDLMRTLRSEHPQVEIIIITGCGSLESATEGIRHGVCDYIQKPFDVVQVTGSVLRALNRHQSRRRLVAFLGELGAVVGRERETQSIIEEVQRSQTLRGRLCGLFEGLGGDPSQAAGIDPARTFEFLEVLAETIETKDRFMRGHARRVAFYTSLMAHRLQLSDEEHEVVRIAAFLHDLGKVGVPTALLMRPGALDPAERALVEAHPEIGTRLLKPLDISTAITTAIRHHHEWWDGTGYPDGLAGEEIPLAARVVSVADAFDAMSSDRPYRKALTRDVVVSELRRYAGSQFDPSLVKEFLTILETGVCDVDAEFLAESVAEGLHDDSGTGALN